MFFPDPVLDKAALGLLKVKPKRTGVLCTHCHREIRGRILMDEGRKFDEYCWQFRFSIREGDPDIRNNGVGGRNQKEKYGR